ncbi:hypothetical protein COCC4DRAFT_22436 [Bipolaris maydis ATCC 48331]|uniref:Uncharacterized protein n=2 Tax=Cochliobolus heterostrophus TaxID=5016 RepID=M2UDX0_COCH5|nr:uncharacterized protein COCC4DRAFT_22436 [Bipolaris maydis ATCC 48331]EMD86193.1 hypothetical protein COCHEDRAFT_1160502 [Bipolaris maydis C5]KAJ5030124.1 hypothetical protein J3E73DRAFT_404340 [Bipolaris maydis]ENI06142.1 hypothetical protein COCC4DRAFT_22436 [Bipolaris maydis ATCC 48331]KAJ6213828.1 hypothetical protein PSV09DRAFT_1160502 [Bipolaris maydis]KAJ6275036.1 hypothetical protein PSV08DRAFT_384760 [Bipolaris maydis]
MWLFGRRRRKAAKLRDGGGSAATTERSLPVASAAGQQPNTNQTNNGPRRGPSQRLRRRRGSSRSTPASIRDVDKTLPELSFAKEAWPQSSAEDITALPAQRRLQHSPHLRPITQEHGGILYNFQSHVHPEPLSSVKDRAKLQRSQSMRRDPHIVDSLVRRKSSKRRREHDHVREEEIRAMSLAMPQKRPAGNSASMLRRDSKKVKGAINYRLERPISNVSLPLADSIHSSMSGGSDNRAFRVSALDMFSPRPTIRVSYGSNYHAGDRTSPNARSEKSPRRDRRPMTSNEEKANRRTSRIDDLADHLDTGALRDILERDKRRREKKAKADQERLRRRLERRAEKQNAAEAQAAPVTPRKDEINSSFGLGIERETHVPMEDVRPSTPNRPQLVEMPVTPPTQVNNQLPTPFDSPAEEPVVSDAQAIRFSRGSASSPLQTRVVSNASILPELLTEKLGHDTPIEFVHFQEPARSGSLHPVDTIDTTATSKKAPSMRRLSTEGKRLGVFASLFRRGKRNSQDQTRPPPSEASFSNTSRESMSRQYIPIHLVGTAPVESQPMQIKRPSSVPRRTRSKFREDLPEFPISPPDSRVQSPEAPATTGLAARRRSRHLSDIRVGPPSDDRSDSPVSPSVPTNNMSQSLASVDSEASWLSGRPLKRPSNRSQMRSSLKSSAVLRHEEFNPSYEELGMADDEYFKNLTGMPNQRGSSPYGNDDRGRRASSTLMALDTAVESDEEVESTVVASTTEEGDQRVQSGVARQPTIVYRRPRIQSTEGLLSVFTDDTGDRSSKAAEVVMESPTQESPTSPTSDSEPMVLQRAKSVDLGKHHVRHLSAGSARLLDIHKRSSIPLDDNSSARRPEHE